MLRGDREIHSRDEIDAIIGASDVCRLAFAVGDEPYLVPLSFGYDGEALFFHTARSGKKIDMLTRNPRVCFEMEANVQIQTDEQTACRWSFAFESVIGFGTVSEITAPAEMKSALNQIMRHHSGREWEFEASSLAATRIWRLTIETLSGKRAEMK